MNRVWEQFHDTLLVVNIALLSYYYPVVGWTLYYAGHAFLFTFTSSGFEAGAFLDSFFNSPATMFAMHSAVALIVGIVLYFGIQRGVKRLVVFAIPVLLFTALARRKPTRLRVWMKPTTRNLSTGLSYPGVL